MASYVAKMERRYGMARAQQLIFEGPAHALIFPNLFLGETNVAIVQPIGVEEWIGRTTHRLRRVGSDLKMCAKKAVLVNAAEPLPNLTFLI